MLNDLYKGILGYSYHSIDNIISKEEHIPDYDITLAIDSSKLPKTQSKISLEFNHNYNRGKEDLG